MGTNNVSSISHARSIDDIGSFWDTHDGTEYDTDRADVVFTFRRTIAIEIHLYEAIERVAHQQGVSPETLINLWLQQKMYEERPANV